MKAGTVFLIVLIVAVIWVWRHHTVSATKACVTAPAQVCIDRPTTTTRRR